MFSFPIGIYPDSRHRHLLFSNVIYPTAVLPVPYELTAVDKLVHEPEQATPTDLSTHKTNDDEDRNEAPARGASSEASDSKSSLNFGIDKILQNSENSDRKPIGEQEIVSFVVAHVPIS